jgi:hypothetical protein
MSFESNMDIAPMGNDKECEQFIEQKIGKSVITPHTPYSMQSQGDISILNEEPNIDNSPLSQNDSSYRTSFPEAVHNMVEESDKNFPDVIHWILDGEAFVVREKVSRIAFGAKFIVMNSFFSH